MSYERMLFNYDINLLDNRAAISKQSMSQFVFVKEQFMFFVNNIRFVIIIMKFLNNVISFDGHTQSYIFEPSKNITALNTDRGITVCTDHHYCWQFFSKFQGCTIINTSGLIGSVDIDSYFQGLFFYDSKHDLERIPI